MSDVTKKLLTPMEAAERLALMTLDEVAQELRCSKEHARKLTQLGRLPFVPTGLGEKRKRRCVRRDDLEAFKRATSREHRQAENTRILRQIKQRPAFRSWPSHYGAVKDETAPSR